jgi:hypothetical protein
MNGKNSVYPLRNIISLVLKKCFSADLRSLAVLRICLSALILYDLSIRFTDIETLYSNNGFYPASMAFGFNPFIFSLFFLTDLYYLHVVFFFLAAISVLLLGLGYKTRFTTVISWLLLLSIHNRNVFQNDGGDNIILITLFLGNFLPWGLRYSLDSIKSSAGHIKNNTVYGFGIAIFFLQIGLIYLTSAIHKRSDVWITEGNGVFYALSIGHFQTMFSDWLLRIPSILPLLNFSVLFIEIFAIFGLFWPSKNWLYRTATIIILIGMHLGFAFGLNLGTFSFVLPVVLLGLLPTWSWSQIKKLLNTRKFTLKSEPTYLKINETIQVKAFLMLFITYIIILNIITIYPLNKEFSWFYQLNKSLSFSQDWRFFGPKPTDYSLWFVAEGTLKTGEQIDLLTGKIPNFERPHNISNIFPNSRWRNFLDKIHSYNQSLTPAAHYLCKKWNVTNKEKILSLKLFSLTQTTNPKEIKNIQIKELTSINCLQATDINVLFNYGRPTNT